MTLFEEIFTTTRLDRDQSKRIAAVLEGEPPIVISSFWALIKCGLYDADEILDRIRSLKAMVL